MKMCKLLILIVMTCVSFVGCATIDRSQFDGDKKYDDISAAVENVKSIGRVVYGDIEKMEIGKDSPLLKSRDASGRFELVELSGRAGQTYWITVAAKCDCLGFRKWSIIPKSFLIDKEGNVLSKGVFASPVVSYVEGRFPRDGEYYLLVVADDSNIGKKVGDISIGVAIPGQPFLPGVFNVAMTAHNTGLVQINWERK